MRKIYLLFTQFPTIRAKLMGKLTGYPYIHASLGLDEDMNIFYSFRYKGYFVEQATRYVAPDREPFPCQLYEYEVEDKVYEEIKTILRYFEEYNFDSFAQKLETLDIKYVHEVKEHSWGQRVVRFYDPDMHIIEVGENMKVVCKRFLDSGMTPEQVAKRMDVPIKFVNGCMR